MFTYTEKKCSVESFTQKFLVNFTTTNKCQEDWGNEEDFKKINTFYIYQNKAWTAAWFNHVASQLLEAEHEQQDLLI